MTESIKDKVTNKTASHESEKGDAANNNPKKLITLTRTRKSTSLLKVKDTSGKAKTIKVQVRKKRTYVKSNEGLIDEETNRAKEAKEKELAVEQEKIEQEKVAQEASGQNQSLPEATPTTPAEPAVVSETPKKDQYSIEEKKLAPSEAEKKKLPEKTNVVLTAHKEKAERDKKHKARSLKEKEMTKYRHKNIYQLSDETDEEFRYRKKGGRHKRADQFLQQQFERPTVAIKHEVGIPETITVGELAQKMSVKAAEVIKSLMKLGVIATINQPIEQDTATIVVEEMGHVAKPISSNALEEGLVHTTQQQMGELLPRPPVVTIMGHVDHGKTSLLDYIRRTKVTQGEAGGITQHIGAYHVEVPKGVITFLDTPGHSAFTAMRARGARVTDIVVLVVAADDGVMPQTVEAIQHAKAAKVPIVVAINKIDKPEADLDRIKNELAKHELIPEEWGGDTMLVPVSAKTGEGIDNLLDSLLVQAEVLELKAPQEGPGQGIVVESRLDKGRGPVVTILVRRGKVSKGDILLAGIAYGRVRALLNERGQFVESAGPSMPVEVLGLSNAPVAGDEVVVVTDERKAREIALFREGKLRETKLAQQRAIKSEDIFSYLDEGQAKVLNIILKTDVQGSAEAIKEALNKLSTSEVKINLVGVGIGAITESDVNLAITSKALILGFNVRADVNAKSMVEKAGLIMHYHGIIYDLIDQVKNVMNGLLSPEIKETVLGMAEVREVFRSAKLGVIAGCMVTSGLVRRNAAIRVLRDNVVMHEGELHSLRRFKEDAAEVRNGMECGIGIKNFTDIRVGDFIEVFERTSIARSI
ncbi:translation initiation factor IF-2 [Candidatus Rickettsiella viridis]|uniref:Translation initiation factor IF-2 n=1 Tax=Candidatus Rickettsiella viridis TaxID=676208 RepID=A0A2Z5UX15_9COXI|nr:translation initiation factor IF-2 [Candidatus Rickettsiella viridis]BBB15540.1 translation initiation factor IF-2 [Candidatus Rickettsiella viridis]